ncbi:sugar ABC transporter permease [Leifsonia shinshuensis]|uniref:carbohydrate ABC transporter permease n=1 Tax=Leifsonia shinshuensis TaxID=150026 RepID=UPI002866AC62|nr:sugar ABC transporter permease [Leifsonia shinshuensis]MDR6971629.1 raffinose/stachyose/melibiose transport system permease protein [Leifsonia shinshuensis]
MAQTLTATATDATRTRARRRWQPAAYLYIAPAVLVLAAFIVVPLVQTFQYSFYDWNGIGASTWAGLKNYAAVFTDVQLRDSFLHVSVLLLFYAALPAVLGLGLTIVLSHANRLRGMGFFRTVLFLPQVIASVVVGTIWVSIYAPHGLLNQVLGMVGLGDLARAWLGDYTFALAAIGFIGTWVNTGLCLVLFLGGVQNIEPSVFEAARIDGAGPLREFFGVTLPALRGQIAIALTLTVTATLKTFDIVYITTQGGPGTSTSVPAFEAFNRAFNTGQVGSAAAVAIALTVLIMVISWLITRLQPKETA